MFNPHIHQQQQQQQQQFHQHLRQLQQLFQHQQPPPPPPPQPPPGHHVAHHHHQTPRAMPVPPQTAPPPRMVNLCQTSQTTIIAPNPMLQGAILMQQMQGNMRGFGMGGQQFRQFFTAGARSSLLGPVPMGMAIKSPIMGFPAARAFHPHARYNNYNTTPAAITTMAPSIAPSSSSITTDTTARQQDSKEDSEQMAAGSADEQPAAGNTHEAGDKSEKDGAAGPILESSQILDEDLEEPAAKKPRTERSETIISAEADGALFSSDNSNNTEENQPDDCALLEEAGSTGGSDLVETTEESRAVESQSRVSAPSSSDRQREDDQQVHSPAEEMLHGKEDIPSSPGQPEEGDDGVADGTNKFYCYLCGITCYNQQNFRSHMNSVSHQQRMMEIQHMSNACLVTLLPRVQESLQGAIKDSEKKADLKRWCATCHTHYTSSIMEHRRTEEHKLASRTAISSCTVCKKHFKTAQIFVEHLQSQEHKQKMEKLQEDEGCEALAKLTALDADGVSLEEEEGSGLEEDEETQRSEEQHCSETQDDWSSLKEVTLKNMSDEEQYDPDTVYGSSFFVPVAGFICRLCNKFYHFESSALHTHCKSLTHFENLKSYRSSLSRKDKAAESSRERLLGTDDLTATTQNTTGSSGDISSDTGAETNSPQPNISLTQTENQQHGNDSEPTSQVVATDQEEETATQASVPAQSPALPPAENSEVPDCEPAAGDNGNVEAAEGEELKEAPTVPGKKNSTAKARMATKRRSGRAANKR